MMKKNLCYLLLLFVLAACSKEDSLPNPVISGIEVVGESSDGTQLTVGEPVTFSVQCENVEVTRYEWLVNDVIKGDQAKFVFTPDKRGSVQVDVKIYNADGAVSQQRAGSYQVVDPAPAIDRLTCNGTEVIGETMTMATDSVVKLRFEVTPNNVAVADYSWIVDGVTLETAKTASEEVVIRRSGVVTLAVTLTNLDQVATTRTVTINLMGRYNKGLFFYGTTTEDLAFLHSEGMFYKGNLYKELNHNPIGSGGLNDLYLYDNELYLLTPSAPVSNQAQVVVCDAQTLVKKRIVTADGFNTKALGEIYNLLVVNPDKAYIGHNISTPNNQSGVRVLDMKNGTFATADMAGTNGTMGIDGPGWARMLHVKEKGKVLIGCGSRIQVVNSESDLVEKSIEIDKQRQICDILTGRDGNIYVVVAGVTDKSSPYWFWGMSSPTTPASIVALNPSDFSILSETKILIDGEQTDIRAGLNIGGTCASRTSDELFLVDGSGFSATKVFRYNYKTGVTSLFTDVAKATGMQRMIAGYMAADENGLLYVPTTNYTSSVLGAFKISTGEQVVTSPAYTVSGDGNAIATSLFQ